MAALEKLERLIERDPDKNTANGDRWLAVAKVIGDYLDEHYPIDPLDTAKE